jgi:polyphosphate kinase 2 (PPK2 family)
MFEAPKSPYLVSYDSQFDISTASTTPKTDGHLHKGKHRRAATEKLSTLQRVLAAGDRHSVLLVFQAMDAAGQMGFVHLSITTLQPASDPAAP